MTRPNPNDPQYKYTYTTETIGHTRYLEDLEKYTTYMEEKAEALYAMVKHGFDREIHKKFFPGIDPDKSMNKVDWDEIIKPTPTPPPRRLKNLDQ